MTAARLRTIASDIATASDIPTEPLPVEPPTRPLPDPAPSDPPRPDPYPNPVDRA